MINNTYLLTGLRLYINQSGLTNRSIPLTTTTTSGSKLMAAFISCFATVTVILNGLILASFIRRPNLCTPFNTYIINLVVVDTLSALIPMPLNVIRQLLVQWPFNGLVCTIVLYLSQMINAGNRAAHLMIATNRLWAVAYPLSYRSRHTKRLAAGVVMFAWTLVMCLVTPTTIFDRRNTNYSLSAGDPSCASDTKSYRAFHMTYNALLFEMPEILVLIAYPFLVFTLRRKFQNKVTVVPGKSNQQEALDPPISTIMSLSVRTERSALNNGQQPARDLEDEGQDLTVDFSQGKISATTNLHRQPQADSNFRGGVQRKRHKWSTLIKGHNRLFAFLVISVICCWTPNHVFNLWKDITGYADGRFFVVQYFLIFANSWLNPVLIYLADSRIREAVNDLLKCG